MRRIDHSFTAAIAATALLAATGCASAPDRPEQQLARAETGVEFAEENGAVKYGAQALDRARQHLAYAQNAADDGDYDIALRAARPAEEYQHAPQDSPDNEYRAWPAGRGL